MAISFSGTEFGADVNGGTVVSGAAMGDLSGYTLTLKEWRKNLQISYKEEFQSWNHSIYIRHFRYLKLIF